MSLLLASAHYKVPLVSQVELFRPSPFVLERPVEMNILLKAYLVAVVVSNCFGRAPSGFEIVFEKGFDWIKKGGCMLY